VALANGMVTAVARGISAVVSWIRRSCLVAGALLVAACKTQAMASPAQCEKLLERFIDLKLSEDPRARPMSTEDRATLRGKIALEVQSDSDVRQVKDQCEAEVTEAEYSCAVSARTSKAWNDCIQ
jgi:hypothetical protein